LTDSQKLDKSTTNVKPAKAGIQKYQVVTRTPDPDFHRGDDFYEYVGEKKPGIFAIPGFSINMLKVIS